MVSARLSPDVYETLTSVAAKSNQTFTAALEEAARSYGSAQSAPLSDYNLLRSTVETAHEMVSAIPVGEAMSSSTWLGLEGILRFALDNTEGGETSDQESRKRKERDKRRRRRA